MPDKEYSVLLASDCRLVVSIRMVGGKVVSFEQALTLAIDDFKKNHEKYIKKS